MNRTFCLACGLWLVIGLSAQADLFMLRSGGQVEGELQNVDESPRLAYIVKTDVGGTVTLAKSQVERVVSKSETLQKYEELLPKMPNTLDGHWKMAEWCKRNKQEALRKFHLQEVLKFDDEHAEARHGLGYQRIRGRWVTTEQVLREQGYQLFQGAWRLPQEIELKVANDQAKQKELTWRKELKRLRGKVGEKRGDQAIEEIRLIRDPAAASALAELLANKEETREMKMVYIEVLSKLGNGTNALIQRAMKDKDEFVRDRCLDLLGKTGSTQAVAAFIAYLKSDDPVMINRAGIALSHMKHQAATLPLINALKTEHKTVSGGGAGISTGFGADGGGGLSMGGKPTVKIVIHENDGVLIGLTATHDGVNFGYDQARWRSWWDKQNMPKEFDFRRDP